ncbi:HAD family hydrolase [Paenactinomyces guangxiensis]|uniref:HAD family hydrolase n=1 Tax=Paenactinomyces guangxiensis TaxID=1490290 RepID=A0A7W1WMS4_9BACL|nr:HAD family hydrolase [Paenactinomyces guangxiensis]MBA4492756.1 HAD family hydrolase [Paenactinomyces guangxiensis]MBH8590395.1 HAD family hydrolase [Paenactinomyces guangxiensis]
MYDIILFDVDGVFLSEERCFDASALSVWELLNAPQFLSLAAEYTTKPDENMIRRIRQEVFQNDQVLDWMKSRGINSNWDMVFLTFSAQLLLLLKELYPDHKEKVQDFLQQPVTEASLQDLKQWGGSKLQSFTPSFSSLISLYADREQIAKHELLVYFNDLAERWFGIPVSQFSRNSSLWELGYSVYQEWYLGDKLYQEIEGKEVRCSGKEGFLHQEIPITEPEKIRSALNQLAERGITLGIGTGRSLLETEVPLKALGLYSHFAESRIATASDVIAAEEAYPDHAPLGKPEPFTYILGYLGRSATAEECLSLTLPIPDGKKVLIVGDSVADYLAARKMGCDFAATLTGLTGQAARSKFEELKADYILNDVTELTEIF